MADWDAERAVEAASSGDVAAAVSRARSAIDGYRRLAACEPTVYEPDLAAALDALAGYLAATDRRTDALAAAVESAALFRALAGEAARPWGGRAAVERPEGTATSNDAPKANAAPDRGDTENTESTESTESTDDAALFLPYLARALNNLSVRQHEAGADAAALESARESASLYRILSGATDFAGYPAGASESFRTNPAERQRHRPMPIGEHTPALATALGNLTTRLDEAGQLTEALDTARQAVDVYQQLAAAEPDHYLPLLAQTINNRAVLLRESGESAMAIAATRQAVNLYRSLASTDPATYRDFLAMALGNLANMLSGAGRGRDALPVAQEVADLYRALATEADLPVRPAPVTSGDDAQDETRDETRDEAQDETQDETREEAGGKRRGEPSGGANPYHAPLAAALNNLAVRLAEAGRHDNALTATREASALYRRLSRTNPQAHLGNLAGALTNLGSDLAEAGQTDEALSVGREAVDVTRRLAFGNRPVYLPQLAQAVNNLAVRLHEAGRNSTAMASARESVRLYEELAQRDPDLYADALERTRELARYLATPGNERGAASVTRFSRTPAP